MSGRTSNNNRFIQSSQKCPLQCNLPMHLKAFSKENGLIVQGWWSPHNLSFCNEYQIKGIATFLQTQVVCSHSNNQQKVSGWGHLVLIYYYGFYKDDSQWCPTVLCLQFPIVRSNDSNHFKIYHRTKIHVQCEPKKPELSKIVLHC